MANARATLFLRGIAQYAKILGTPPLNYSKDGREWTMDVQLDKAGEKQLKDAGLADRVKRKDTYLDGAPYVSLRQRELTADGNPNKAPTVVDIRGMPWDHNNKIGNGSRVDVKVSVVDYGVGKKKGVYLQSTRILDHVPYTASEFPDIKEDDEFFAAKSEAEKGDDFVDRFVNGASKPDPVDDPLDDDIP